MKWINIDQDNYSTYGIPTNKTIIVEDEHGWIGQAYWNNYDWVLETFDLIEHEIIFGKIIRYFVIDDN